MVAAGADPADRPRAQAMSSAHAGTILRAGAQTAGHNVAEFLGEIGRQHDGFPGLAQARRRTASERFEQADAERPDVTGSGTAAVPGFRRIVHGGCVGAHRTFTDATDRVACQLQLISNHQDVCRLQLALHQVSAVQERQCVQGRQQHFSRFVVRQGAVQQQLRKSLVGVLHDGVQMGQPVQLAPAPLPQAKQVRMSEAASPLPSRQ